MKHARSLSLLLALLLLAGLMAGCASQPVSTPAESTDTPDETPADTSDETPADTSDETPDENVLFNAHGGHPPLVRVSVRLPGPLSPPHRLGHPHSPGG